MYERIIMNPANLKTALQPKAALSHYIQENLINVSSHHNIDALHCYRQRKVCTAILLREQLM